MGQKRKSDGGLQVGRKVKRLKASLSNSDFQTLSSPCKSKALRQVTAPASTHSMQTRLTTLRLVQKKVFGITELFEEILLNLAVLDLMELQRVSRHWHSVIRNSVRIQQKLFLYPKMLIPIWRFDRSTKELCPYDEASDHRKVRSGEEFEVWKEWMKSQCKMRPSVLNTLLFRQDPDTLRPSIKYRAEYCESIRFKYCPSLAKLGKANIYRCMYLCQPPTAQVIVEFWYRSHKPQLQKARAEVWNPRGVTFGDLLARMVAMVPLDEQPLQEYAIATEPDEPNETRVWMPGAIFVSGDEQVAVQKQVPKPSPLVQEMMSKNKADVVQERSIQWWSKEDSKWAVVNALS